MGWSYRKSFGSGPFRVNFSKSGISYSVGVKGARVNIGPRGTYVNLSSHGISYRRKIQGANQPGGYMPVQSPAQSFPMPVEPAHNIASADIYQLTDTDSRDFIEELTKKSNQSSYINLYGVFPLVVFLLILAFTSFSSKTIITQPESDSTLVQVTSPVGANIRQLPNARSAVMRAAAAGQTFILADSTNHKWLKASFHDSAGYISRRFAVIAHVHHDQATTTQLVGAGPYAGYVLVLGLIGFVLWAT
jgi:hypothetical protein